MFTNRGVRRFLFRKLCLCMLALFITLPHAAAQNEDSRTVKSSYTVNVLFDSESVTMDLEKYILGVILAEIPADFELEAIKAQAVAARTYACKTMDAVVKHPKGSICVDPGCCQGYLGADAYLQKMGSAEHILRVQKAVSETTHQVITYDGELIEATFFSCSGGFTEDAKSVWGTDYPYLMAKESPGEEAAFCFSSTVSLDADTLENILDVQLDESSENWFQNWVYTAGGGVYSVDVGDKSFYGTELRQKLNLRSTIFTAEIIDNEILLTTKGYGHRVGLSQYGANAQAQNGKDYAEILSYYYDGVKLQRLEDMA